MSRLWAVAVGFCALVPQTFMPVSFTMTGREFEATRVLMPGGDVEVTVAGGGELIPLSIRIGGRERLRVSRAAHVVWGLTEPARVRALADGRAVTAFREHVGEFERAVIAGAPHADDTHAFGFLLAGALVAALGGDPVAGARARDVVIRRSAAVAARDGACGASWREHLLEADAQRAACLVVATGRDGWLERAAERTFCDAEFLAAFTAGEARLTACPGPEKGGKSPRRILSAVANSWPDFQASRIEISRISLGKGAGTAVA
jgi:hypothetical protein